MPKYMDVLKLSIVFLNNPASSSVSYSRLMKVLRFAWIQLFCSSHASIWTIIRSFRGSTRLVRRSLRKYIRNYASFQKGCHLVESHSGGVMGTQSALSHPELIRSFAIAGPASWMPKSVTQCSNSISHLFITLSHMDRISWKLGNMWARMKTKSKQWTQTVAAWRSDRDSGLQLCVGL